MLRSSTIWATLSPPGRLISGALSHICSLTARCAATYRRTTADRRLCHPQHRTQCHTLQVCEFLETHIIPQEPPGAAPGAATQAAAAASPPPKVLIFAHHRTVMDRLHMFLQGYDAAAGDGDGLRQVRRAVGHVRIDGSTEHSLRAELQQRFKSDPDCTVRGLRLASPPLPA